jgi:hypothetical protein
MKVLQPKSEYELVRNVICLIAMSNMGLEKGDQKFIFCSGYFKYDCSPAWVEVDLLVVTHLAGVLSCMMSQKACKT